MTGLSFCLLKEIVNIQQIQLLREILLSCMTNTMLESGGYLKLAQRMEKQGNNQPVLFQKSLSHATSTFNDKREKKEKRMPSHPGYIPYCEKTTGPLFNNRELGDEMFCEVS